MLQRAATRRAYFQQLRQAVWGRCYHTRHCFGHWWKQPTQYQVPEAWLKSRSAQPNLWRLVTAYREHGHRKADINPLKSQKRDSPPELSLSHYGLEGEENKLFRTEGIVSGLTQPEATLAEIVEYLEKAYCRTMSLEVSQVNSTEEREWLTQRYEELRDSPLSNERKRELGEDLIRSQMLDNFLGKKFPTVKRYSSEGAESVMAFYKEAFLRASEGGIKDVILSSCFRGRSNLLTGALHFPHAALFHKFQGNHEHVKGAPSMGDVASHLVNSVDLEMPGGEKLHVTLLPMPSHLESGNPVALGKARARQLSQKGGPYSCSPHGTYQDNIDCSSQVLSLQVHGDAGFTGQGVVMESLMMSTLPHYSVGGTVHLIINNQLGFTTESDHGRSSEYCSDIGKMIGCPVIHVNGDHPEDMLRATRIAMDYWLQFQREIIVDMICFRRWGHNELDNPSLTQPLMYRAIEERSSVPDMYTKEIETSGTADISEVATSYSEQLSQSFKESSKYVPQATHLKAHWSGIQSASDHITVWDTGCPVDLLKYIGAKSVEIPSDCNANPRLRQSHVGDRLKKLEAGVGLDWATAEALAIGSLLYQGFNVRLSGEDVGRGTFSHRHAMMVCQDSDASFIPLNHITEDQTAFLEVANSPLSEWAVVGFEYGFSIESPKHLVLWESQFGDFYNGAQIIVDTFISCGEAKWLVQSGMVMLLPHGYDGAGPEHSSCRLERFLQLCNSDERRPDGDSVNMNVTHPTTPAQYYHLLRRQMVRNFRKPLIVASPKTLLRLPAATSTLQEMAPGTTFQPVLGDPWVNPQEVTRVVFCSGKHYYALDSHRKKHDIKDTAIIRVELLCPFPSAYIYQELQRYPGAKEVIWSQEEPENMGPWSFVEPRFRRQLNCNLSFVGRGPYAATACGVETIHRAEVEKLLSDTFPHVNQQTAV